MFCTSSSITILHFGLLLPLLLFLGLSGSTSATKQCKNTVMNIIMKQCSGARFIRDLKEHADQNKEENIRIALLTADDSSDAALVEMGQLLGQQDKRQISSDLASAMAETLKNYARGNAASNLYRSNSAMVPRYDTNYNFPYVDRMPGYYSGYLSSPRLLTYRGEGSGFIPQAAAGDLGLDLSNEEMDELYSEINQRLPRASKSKEEARKIFMATAAKCCQNIELCTKDVQLISCV